MSAETDFVYDVFISYRHREPAQTWVRQKLWPALEAHGLKVCIDMRDFRLGAVLLKEMERAVVQSRYTLAVLTPAYLESAFTEIENLMSDHLGLEDRQLRLLAIMREPCDVSLRMKVRLWLDMTSDAAFEPALTQLVDALRRSVTFEE